jgi:hypothetical protein
LSRVKAKPAGKISAHPFDRCVFVNAPFDQNYLPLLHAILFAIHDCGFIARIAVEDTGSNETRLDKIARIIRESRLSIHDLSRVEISVTSPLPRFNMPFECGLALGAIRFGTKPDRDFLLMAAEPYQDKITLSDMAGQDSKSHKNDPKAAVSATRAFLSAKADPGERTRGADAIWKGFEAFCADLPRLAENLEVTVEEIQSFDYLRDWIQAMALWLLNPPHVRR